MLPVSKLYNFLDRNDAFAVQFFEGQKLLSDIAVVQQLTHGLDYFRDCTLASIHLMHFLKAHEQMGLFIDNENPYFRLKYEFSKSGKMRCLLLPDDFKEFPKALRGRCRIVKHSGGHPYTSIIPLESIDFHEVVNQILTNSYQVNSKVFVSQTSDQSVMISKLPRKNIKKLEENLSDLGLDEYWESKKYEFESLFEKAETGHQEIVSACQKMELTYLMGQEVEFFCPCSLENMKSGIQTLVRSEGVEAVFGVSQAITTKCDYCHKEYQISLDDISPLVQ